MNHIILFLLLALPSSLFSKVDVKIVDFIKSGGLNYNAAGPVIVKADEKRNRVVAANTLSSSISIIDGFNDRVTNIPTGMRAFQHLKNECMVISEKTGLICLIGANAFTLVNPSTNTAETYNTQVQYESAAIDDNSQKVFMCGIESEELCVFDIKTKQLQYVPWLNHSEKLINLNQTPPPPLRKVIADVRQNKIIAVDGFTSQIFILDPTNLLFSSSRKVNLTSGGRWHLAGFNDVQGTLYIVTEKKDRKVIEAARIDVYGNNDIIVKLPEFTEGVAMIYDHIRESVYIPYDNHSTIHVVDFSQKGNLLEIPIPTFGNDASALDFEAGLLYIASWAKGEIYIIDVTKSEFIRKIDELGIIPHMFALTYLKNSSSLYYPLGASAVNGSFGAALTKLNPTNTVKKKIYLGWSPIDMIELKHRGSFLVFNNEDEFAEISYNGNTRIYNLPYDFPICCEYGPDESVYLSYGPHQSYWPTVYIWGAKNGILKIDTRKKVNEAPKKVIMSPMQLQEFSPESYYDRRIPRQAMKMILNQNGALYFPQNCWGKEPQFVNILKDRIRYNEIGERIITGDTIERENTQRVFAYDSDLNRIYLGRVGEKDDDPSILHIISTDSNKVLKRIEIGSGITDLVYDRNSIYTSNFNSNNVSVININNFNVREINVGEGPLKLCRYENNIYVLNHLSGSIQNISRNSAAVKIPYDGLPDNIGIWKDRIIITLRNNYALYITAFNPTTETFELLFKYDYPYGDTRFDTVNSSFYISGQFGDAIYNLSKIKSASDGALWISDFLAGKVYIIK